LRPVELNYVTFQDKMGNPDRPLPAEGASFLQIDQPNVVLVTWKQAEDGNGTILRLLETAGHDTTAAIRFEHLTVDAAKLCNAVEDDLKDLRVEGNTLRVNLRANEVVTVRVQ
jgi:alpha-mannosidase